VRCVTSTVDMVVMLCSDLPDHVSLKFDSPKLAAPLRAISGAASFCISGGAPAMPTKP
jgi:hypothetical protein